MVEYLFIAETCNQLIFYDNSFISVSDAVKAVELETEVVLQYKDNILAKFRFSIFSIKMANYTIVGIDNRLLTIDPEFPPLVYTFSRLDSYGDGGLAVKIYEIDPATGVVTGDPILDLPFTNVSGYSDPHNLSLAGGKSYVIQPDADQWPSEVSWVVHDNNGAVVQSLNGNNLEETAGNETGNPNPFAEYNQANYLDFTFTCPNLDTKTYEWKRGTVIVSSTATYRLVADDTDNVITVTVTEDGAVSTDSTSTIISLADARSNGYTASQGHAVGYTATEMKAAGYTATELKAAGYTATELKAGGYTVSELKAGEYTLAEILSANFYTTEILANFDAVQWKQVGADIDGEAAGDFSGYSVSMNSTGTRVAIGAYYNDGNGNKSGHTRVYENNDGTWGQLGADIDGEAGADRSGNSVSMNSTGTKVAIGAYLNDGNGDNSGHTRVYEYNGTTWGQLGADIDGEALNDKSGWSVSMSSDGTMVAIGGVSNDGNGSNSGHVRVYEQVTLLSLIDAVGGGVFPGIDFYFEGLASTLTLNEAIEFLDVDFQSSTLEDIPHVEITLTDPQRIQLNKMFVVELAEDTHIDQATSTLTDEVYESSVTGYQTDETKMPHMGTDLSLATKSLKNNGHRVSPTTHGEASVKFMQRNMDTDTIANSFVSDLIHQAILFRFVENELSNEEYLVDEIEEFLEGTETYHLSGILNQKLIDSKTDETQPHSLAYASFHTLVKSITDSANAQQNKRLTNDPINGMFRNANKVGYVDENNQGDDNAYYMEFLAGDHFIFKLTLNPSATPVAPVYANGQVPSQQPRSLFIKLKIE